MTLFNENVTRGPNVNFISKLSAAWTRNDSLLCVGLDPDLARLPAHLQAEPDGIVRFCTAIIDATADLACAFKPQIAYFAALGAESQLEQICRYLRERYPHIPLILDAKRGDIGATAHQYAREVFVRYRADAVTLSPLLGCDSIEPYLRYEGKGAILLCRTSQASAPGHPTARPAQPASRSPTRNRRAPDVPDRRGGTGAHHRDQWRKPLHP